LIERERGVEIDPNRRVDTYEDKIDILTVMYIGEFQRKSIGYKILREGDTVVGFERLQKLDTDKPEEIVDNLIAPYFDKVASGKVKLN